MNTVDSIIITNLSTSRDTFLHSEVQLAKWNFPLHFFISIVSGLLSVNNESCHGNDNYHQHDTDGYHYVKDSVVSSSRVTPVIFARVYSFAIWPPEV